MYAVIFIQPIGCEMLCSCHFDSNNEYYSVSSELVQLLGNGLGCWWENIEGLGQLVAGGGDGERERERTAGFLYWPAERKTD